jgi:hypothetical protein
MLIFSHPDKFIANRPRFSPGIPPFNLQGFFLPHAFPPGLGKLEYVSRDDSFYSKILPTLILQALKPVIRL